MKLSEILTLTIYLKTDTVFKDYSWNENLLQMLQLIYTLFKSGTQALFLEAKYHTVMEFIWMIQSWKFLTALINFYSEGWCIGLSTVSFRVNKFYGSYNDLICKKKLSFGRILFNVFFFIYWLLILTTDKSVFLIKIECSLWMCQ